MKLPWSRFFWSDFLAETSRLSNEELGAYVRLMGDVWTNGSLPESDRELAQIARSSPYSWKKIKPTVAKFFRDGWRHERLENERQFAADQYEKKASSGREGGRARARNMASVASVSVERRQDSDVANAYQSEPETETDTSSLRSDESGGVLVSLAKARSVARKGKRTAISAEAQPTDVDRAHVAKLGWSNGFAREQWTKFVDYHLSRGSMMKDWSAAWRTWCGNVPNFQRPAVGAATAPRNAAIAATEKILREMDERDRQANNLAAEADAHDAVDAGGGGFLPRIVAKNGAPSQVLDLEAERAVA